MLSKKRKTIGLFINRTGFFFENTVYRVAQEQGRLHDMNVVFFCTLGHRGSANVYDELEKAMFDFAPLETLDGIIITPDTYQMEGYQEALYDALKRRATCPIVSIRDHNAPYDQVATDEDNAIRPLLRHLIDDHGYQRIHFLAGFKGHPDSERRLLCYYDEMARYQLPLPENAVFYGTMWRSGGDVACDYFFQEGLPQPEAIVCANDYMAQTVSEELKKRGVRIPTDVCVTGFDNVEEQAGFPVRLTTVEQDYEGIVAEAFVTLKERMAQRDMGQVSPEQIIRKLPVKLIKRESCGCPWHEKQEDQKAKLLETSQQMQNIRVRETSQMYFSIDMNACTTVEEIHNTIISRRDDVPEMRDYYLCTFEESPGSGEKEGYAEHLTEHVTLISAMQNHEDKGMPMDHFPRKQLLPDWVWDSDEPQSFFTRILHQRDSIYGYCLVRYEVGKKPSLFYHEWNATISSALRHLFNQSKLQRLYEERKLSSITDPLTGLYNRRGLEELVLPGWEERCRASESATVLSFDMDNLKPINDSYGHQAGDDALQTVAQVLKGLVWPGTVAARIGGDEFLVFLPRCNAQGAAEMMQEIDRSLEEHNQKKGKPYQAAMSGGTYVCRLTPGMTLDQCIMESDRRMYSFKRQRKLAQREQE